MLDKLFDCGIIKADEGFSVLNGCLEILVKVNRLTLGVRAVYFLIDTINNNKIVKYNMYSIKSVSPPIPTYNKGN